jgi:hypothetical protein
MTRNPFWNPPKKKRASKRPPNPTQKLLRRGLTWSDIAQINAARRTRARREGEALAERMARDK